MRIIPFFMLNSLRPLWLATAIAGLVIWSGSGCSGKDPLIISAASSLGPVLDELKPAAEATCGSRIALNLAGSGALRTQIESGAPADVFIPAASPDMDLLEKAGLILRDTRRDCAANALVLVAATRTPADGADDLATTLAGWSRIAVGDPVSAPVGRYTTKVLARLGLKQSLSTKVVTGNSVRQIVSYIETGSVDGGFVFATDAQRLIQAGKARHLRRFTPAESGGEVRYPAAVLARSHNPEAARKFVLFLSGTTAQAAFERAGFARP